MNFSDSTIRYRKGNHASQMNVLMILPYFYPQYGGAENQALQLAQHVNCSQRARITILTLEVTNSQRLESFDGLQVYRFGHCQDKTGRLHGYRQMEHWIKQYASQSQGVHQHIIYGANPLAQLHLGAIARAQGLWQVVKITSTEKISLMQQYWPASIELLKQADAVIALNDAIYNELIEAGILHKAIVCIPNGVNTALFSPAASWQKRVLRQRLGLPLHGTLFLFVGRLVEKKGLDVLLKAWAAHERHEGTSRLLVIGDDCADRAKSQTGRNTPCGEKGKAYARRLGLHNILWLGAQEHRVLPWYYKACDCLVLPSRNEGCPNVVLEAMSTGLPVIGTRIPGIEKLVSDGCEGLIIEVDHEAQLTCALNRIQGNPDIATKLGQQARSRALEEFSLDRVSSSYESLYSQLDQGLGKHR